MDETLETMLLDMATNTQEKLLSILEFTLSRLARYDEGNPIGALLSMAPRPNSIFNKMKNLVGDQTAPNANKTGAINNNVQATYGGQNLQTQTVQNNAAAHLGQAYVTFMRGSSETLQQVIVDEVWVNRLFEVYFVFYNLKKNF